MNDLISRQAAIDLAKDICVPTKDGSTYRHRCIDPDAIRELQDAQKWIPVEEQNPEIDMSYPHSVCYLVTYEGGTLDVARWSNVNPFWTDHVTEPRWWGQQFCKVVAWMPLPEPYRERSEND